MQISKAKVNMPQAQVTITDCVYPVYRPFGLLDSKDF